MALVGSILELGGAEADLKMVCKVLLGKSYDFIFPALLKVIDLQVQMLLTAVIYCISFRQDHFSSDTHRCVAMLPRNGNTVPGTSPSLPFPHMQDYVIKIYISYTNIKSREWQPWINLTPETDND